MMKDDVKKGAGGTTSRAGQFPFSRAAALFFTMFAMVALQVFETSKLTTASLRRRSFSTRARGATGGVGPGANGEGFLFDDDDDDEGGNASGSGSRASDEDSSPAAVAASVIGEGAAAVADDEEADEGGAGRAEEGAAGGSADQPPISSAAGVDAEEAATATIAGEASPPAPDGGEADDGAPKDIEGPSLSSWRFPFSGNFTRMVYERSGSADGGGNNRTGHPNFVTPFTGCYIASWFLNDDARKPEANCLFKDDVQNRHGRAIDRAGNLERVQPNDTIYVPLGTLEHFVDRLLPNITVDVVVITGKNHLLGPKFKKNLPHLLEALCRNAHVLKVFCHNLDAHAYETAAAAGFSYSDDSKLAPFPYGIDARSDEDEDHLELFAEAFARYVELPPKTQDVFVGYVNVDNNPEKRKDVPSGPMLPMDKYYDEIARSRFVYSPDGDRPDCYRHYESLAFGAIPVTQLNPKYYWHFDGGPIIYNNTEWRNRTPNNFLNQLGVDEFPAVNRAMIFEEYWMEYVDSVVGRELRWWDRKDGRPATIGEMMTGITTTTNSAD